MGEAYAQKLTFEVTMMMMSCRSELRLNQATRMYNLQTLDLDLTQIIVENKVILLH